MAYNTSQSLEGHQSAGRVGEQTPHGLQIPFGFLESAHHLEQGALFFATSTVDGRFVTHLIRDTPDDWLHLGWSPTAEIRTEGRWIRLADTSGTVTQDFQQSSDNHQNPDGRWSLRNCPSKSGFPVAHVLCNAAIDWWDSGEEAKSGGGTGIQAHHFCAVFPSTVARRSANDPAWHLVCATETAEWILGADQRWAFHTEIHFHDRVAAAGLTHRLTEPWKNYSRMLDSIAARSVEDPELLNLTAIAGLLAHGHEFPVLEALLPTILRDESVQSLTFEVLKKYSAVNAVASITTPKDLGASQLSIQNDLMRWDFMERYWIPAGREQTLSASVEIHLNNVCHAAMNLTKGNSSMVHNDFIHPYSQLLVVTDSAAEMNSDFPLFDVVRGVENNRGRGWRHTGDRDNLWAWTTIGELNCDRYLPLDEGEDALNLETVYLKVDENLGLFLEEFWAQVISYEVEYETNPTWQDFLLWVRDFS